LASLYQSMGRPDDAARVFSEMIRVNPTPDSFAAAVRGWTALGDFRQAAIVRAEAQRALITSPEIHESPKTLVR
jgi:pentatricopeptide repeat protein